MDGPQGATNVSSCPSILHVVFSGEKENASFTHSGRSVSLHVTASVCSAAFSSRVLRRTRSNSLNPENVTYSAVLFHLQTGLWRQKQVTYARGEELVRGEAGI